MLIINERVAAKLIYVVPVNKLVNVGASYAEIGIIKSLSYWKWTLQ